MEGDEDVPGRIIPARAGFTTEVCWAWRKGPDHPRSRGVYVCRVGAGPSEVGSSPLARGLQARPGVSRRPGGIIPARAGFTLVKNRIIVESEDHPRSRGVYNMLLKVLYSLLGSSPLARGLRSSIPWTSTRTGIIPARAGFTPNRHSRSSGRPDHPRSRGVYLWMLIEMRHIPGSSPLARGLRRGPAASLVEPRIIPARAGFTRRISPDGRSGGDHPRSRGVYVCCRPCD